MTRHLARVAAFIVFLVTAAPAAAQWRIGGALGAEHESSWDEFLVVTLEARRSVIQGKLDLAPRFSYYIRDGVTRFQIDANVIKPLELAHPCKVTPFLGIGGAIEQFRTNDIDESSVGFNYIMGGTMKAGSRAELYGQFQYTVLHDNPNAAVVSAGVLFRLGRQ